MQVIVFMDPLQIPDYIILFLGLGGARDRALPFAEPEPDSVPAPCEPRRRRSAMTAMAVIEECAGIQ